MSRVQPVNDLRDLSELLSTALEAIEAYYIGEEKIRPKKKKKVIERRHIKALYRVFRTLIDDLDALLDQALPSAKYVQKLVDLIYEVNRLREDYLRQIEILMDLNIEPKDKMVVEGRHE